jgi:hypothetical protein
MTRAEQILDEGELVDGAAAFVEMRRRLNGVG